MLELSIYRRTHEFLCIITGNVFIIFGIHNFFSSALVGSRLEKEIQYTKKALKSDYGSSAELLIQTPYTDGTNVLNVEAMQQHLKAVKRATEVTVNVYNQ